MPPRRNACIGRKIDREWLDGMHALCVMPSRS